MVTTSTSEGVTLTKRGGSRHNKGNLKYDTNRDRNYPSQKENAGPGKKIRKNDERRRDQSRCYAGRHLRKTEP